MAIAQSFLTQITNVHFPPMFPYFGVYVKVTPTPNGQRWANVATAILAGSFGGNVLGSGAGVGQVINPYTVPAEPTFAIGGSAAADGRFIAAGSPGNSTLNMQGSNIVRLARGTGYSGSITVRAGQSFVGLATPPTIAVSLAFYLLRLVPGTTMTFSSGGGAISIPVSVVLGTISYTLTYGALGQIPQRVDNFSFTSP